MSNTKITIKYPKINISYELVGTPSCLLADPDRYLKLFGSTRSSSTVVNLPMGSVNKSYYEYDYKYSISKNKYRNKNNKQEINYTKTYENFSNQKGKIPSFANRMKYSKSLEKIKSIRNNSKNGYGHSVKKRNLNINLAQSNNDDENYYDVINTSSTGKENKKYYKNNKNKKTKGMVNHDVQVLSSLNDEDEDGYYYESKNKNNRNNKQNKNNKNELSENIINTTIKINKLLIQLTNQKNKIKEMANESYYHITTSENNQNDASSNNFGINTNSNETGNNNDYSNSNINNSNSNINNSNSNVNNSNSNMNNSKSKNSGINVNNLKNNIRNKNSNINNNSKSNNTTSNKNKNKSSLTKKKIKNVDVNLEKYNKARNTNNKNNKNNKNNENDEFDGDNSRDRNSRINHRNRNRDKINNNNNKYHKNSNSFVPETTHNKSSHRNDYSLNDYNSYNSNRNLNYKKNSKEENSIQTYSSPFIKCGRRCIPCYTLLDERLHKNRNLTKSKKKKHKNYNSANFDLENNLNRNEIMTPSLELNNKNHNHNRAKSYKEENIKKNLDFENTDINSNIKFTNENSTNNNENYEEKSILKIDNLCKRGFNGPDIKKINQDNFFIYNNFNNNPDYVFMGVCDGHGLYGHFVSSFLANTLPQNMNDNILEKNISKIENISFENLENIIRDTFITTNIQLSEDGRIDITYSGSTCVSILLTPKKLICANVGDSRCILGKFNNEKWFSKNLSRDHKPNIPNEYERIIKMGGRVDTYKDNENNCFGPDRVWLKNEDTPGLAMSRSFGDEVAHSIGVISEPEIIENYFLIEDKFIIIGSDGLWEFISSDEVVNIVKDFYLKNDIQGAFESLFKESTKRWLIEEGVIDDITILIVFLKEKDK